MSSHVTNPNNRMCTEGNFWVQKQTNIVRLPNVSILAAFWLARRSQLFNVGRFSRTIASNAWATVGAHQVDLECCMCVRVPTCVYLSRRQNGTNQTTGKSPAKGAKILIDCEEGEPVKKPPSKFVEPSGSHQPVAHATVKVVQPVNMVTSVSTTSQGSPKNVRAVRTLYIR